MILYIRHVACFIWKFWISAILEYILADLRERLSLALAWLYEEYSILQGFYKLPEILQHQQKPDHNYNTLLCSLALTVIKRYEYKDKDA